MHSTVLGTRGQKEKWPTKGDMATYSWEGAATDGFLNFFSRGHNATVAQDRAAVWRELISRSIPVSLREGTDDNLLKAVE